MTFQLQIRGKFKRLSHNVATRLQKAKTKAKHGFRVAKHAIENFLDDMDQSFYEKYTEHLLDEENLAILSALEQERFKTKMNVALAISKYVSQLPRNVLYGVCHPLVVLGDGWRKTIKPEDIGRDIYDDLYYEIASAKLGLPSQSLKDNMDFCSFAVKHALHRYLMVFNHELLVKNKKIHILFNGKYQEWETVKPLLRWKDTDPPTIIGHYSAIGLVDQGIMEWKTLEPFIVLPSTEATVDENNVSNGKPPVMRHDWGDRYILEFCSWIIDKPRLSGDHLWLRLKTPSGEVYSFGQYRPRKLTHSDYLFFPFRLKVSEFYVN